MDRGAWWAIVYGVTKSQTQLSDFTFTFNGVREKILFYINHMIRLTDCKRYLTKSNAYSIHQLLGKKIKIEENLVSLKGHT